MTNAYQHALDTKRIALNDNGLLAWVKHNMPAIMEALGTVAKMQNLNDNGVTDMRVEIDQLPVPPIHELQIDPVPVGFEIWQDEGLN